MDKETNQEILKELKDLNQQIKEMSANTNYELRRIATRIEEMNR